MFHHTCAAVSLTMHHLRPPPRAAASKVAKAIEARVTIMMMPMMAMTEGIAARRATETTTLEIDGRKEAVKAKIAEIEIETIALTTVQARWTGTSVRMVAVAMARTGLS